MNISLTDELEDYVLAQVKTGYYRSASEVVREALRNQIRGSLEEKMRDRVKASRQQVEEGQIVSADDAYFEKKRKRIQGEFLQDKGQ